MDEEELEDIEYETESFPEEDEEPDIDDDLIISEDIDELFFVDDENETQFILFDGEIDVDEDDDESDVDELISDNVIEDNEDYDDIPIDDSPDAENDPLCEPGIEE